MLANGIISTHYCESSRQWAATAEPRPLCNQPRARGSPRVRSTTKVRNPGMGNNEAFDGMPQRRPVSRSLGLSAFVSSSTLSLSLFLSLLSPRRCPVSTSHDAAATSSRSRRQTLYARRLHATYQRTMTGVGSFLNRNSRGEYRWPRKIVYGI